MIKYKLWIECYKCGYKDIKTCKGYRLPFRCPSCASKDVSVCGQELTDDEITGMVLRDGSIQDINDWNKEAEEDEIEYEQYKKQLKNSTITCPYCQSTDCKKLGVVSRGISFGLFGFGSGKLGKQWHCNSCDSDF